MDAIERKMNFDGIKDVRLQGLLEMLFLAARDSQWMNVSQKRVIEQKIYEIARIAASENYS